MNFLYQKYEELINTLFNEGVEQESQREKLTEKCRPCAIAKCKKSKKCKCRCHISSCRKCDYYECDYENCAHYCHNLNPNDKIFGEDNNISQINFNKDENDKFCFNTSNNYQSMDRGLAETSAKTSRSKYDTGAFPIQNLGNNYFATKSTHGNAMETIVEEEKSGFISKHNLAIPPERIVSQDNSLYTTSPLNNFTKHENSRNPFKDHTQDSIEKDLDAPDFQNLMIPNFKSSNHEKNEANKSFDINNTQLIGNNTLNNSNLSANRSIEKSRNNWDQNTFKKLRLTNSIQRSRGSHNSSIDSTNRRAIDQMTLSANLKCFQPELESANKKVNKANSNNKEQERKNNQNNNIKVVEAAALNIESEKDNQKNVKIVANSRFSSNESNIILDNLGGINIKKQVDEENDEVIHFNNEEMEKNMIIKFNRESIDFETSIKPIQAKEISKNNNKINNNKSNNSKNNNQVNSTNLKVNENSNVFKKAEDNIILETEEIKINNEDNVSVNSKMSKVSESRKKRFDKSIKDVSIANKIRSNLSPNKKLASSKNVSKTKSVNIK